MAYLCLKCYETYELPFQNCPKASCYGPVAEIDDLMLPIIMILNQKGYCTKFCCSGHVYEKGCYPYIMFDSFLNEILDEDEFNNLFKKLPEPWYIENHISNEKTIRCDIEISSMVELQKLICYVNLALLDFVNELPELFCDEEVSDNKEIKVGTIYG